jgi:hypothetical protein
MTAFMLADSSELIQNFLGGKLYVTIFQRRPICPYRGILSKYETQFIQNKDQKEQAEGKLGFCPDQYLVTGVQYQIHYVS